MDVLEDPELADLSACVVHYDAARPTGKGEGREAELLAQLASMRERAETAEAALVKLSQRAAKFQSALKKRELFVDVEE